MTISNWRSSSIQSS